MGNRDPKLSYKISCKSQDRYKDSKALAKTDRNKSINLKIREVQHKSSTSKINIKSQSRNNLLHK